ncbi:MAG: hypothetical protein HYS14_05395 [Candidatus Rokubacteria bacterium]|nr:hypothetical protein [Candidatus Rokubacteria bacterium]
MSPTRSRPQRRRLAKSGYIVEYCGTPQADDWRVFLLRPGRRPTLLRDRISERQALRLIAGLEELTRRAIGARLSGAA